jgi:hypothetical protein
MPTIALDDDRNILTSISIALETDAPLLFTANDCLDIGTDIGSPVSLDYYDKAPFEFNGKIEQAQVKYLGFPARVQEEKRQTDGPIPSDD